MKKNVRGKGEKKIGHSFKRLKDGSPGVGSSREKAREDIERIFLMKEGHPLP